MDSDKVSGYCARCKKNVIFIDTKEVLTKNGRKRLAGICDECKKSVSKFIKKIKEPMAKEKDE